MNLMKMDWDQLEQILEDELSVRIRTYDSFKYMIIDANHVLVKVYEDNQLVFTIKFWLRGDKLEVSEAY